MTKLAGKQIVITRPIKQSAHVKKLLEEQQADVILFPVIEIQASSYNLPSDIGSFDWFIFISPNAVKYGLKALDDADISAKTIAAIGKKTAEKLEQKGIQVNIVPKNNFNTESFLELSETQAIEAKRVLIFRGNGGRELLASSLQQRGAHVEYAEVYQRVRPQNDTKILKYLWQQQLIDMLVITSSEGLYNLYSMIKDDWIKHVPLLLGSPRIMAATTDLGHQGKIITATNPSDEVIVKRLLDWAK